MRAIAFCPDEELVDCLTAHTAFSTVHLTRSFRRYPADDELPKILRASAPEIVFLGAEQISRLAELVALMERQLPNARVIALGRKADPNLIPAMLNTTGVHDVLYFPYDDQQLAGLLSRSKQCLDRMPVTVPATDLIFSFLPSKPGAGASTLAANLAVAAGRLRPDPSLLLDCDRGNGIIRFLLQIDKSLALPDLARNAFHLDEVIWRQIATSIENMDVIHSGDLDSDQRIEPVHLRRILEFAQRNYNAVFLDLSGTFDGPSIAAMEASKQIFIVVTPELASAHMAREKINYLKRLNLISRSTIVLNRAQKKSLLTREQIEDVLKLPVVASFSNDYHRVNAALTAGKPVEAQCELGLQLESFASALLEGKQTAGEAKGRLTDYFSLTAAKSLFRVVEVMRAEGELR